MKATAAPAADRPSAITAPRHRGKITAGTNTPAYYLGQPATVWITAMRPRRSRTQPLPGRPG
jgi:hypothetical protein